MWMKLKPHVLKKNLVSFPQGGCSSAETATLRMGNTSTVVSSQSTTQEES